MVAMPQMDPLYPRPTRLLLLPTTRREPVALLPAWTKTRRAGLMPVCDCEGGLRKDRYGLPYPCPFCVDGDWLVACERAADDHAYVVDTATRRQMDQEDVWHAIEDTLWREWVDDRAAAWELTHF